MFGAIILTFVITSLIMLVIFLFRENDRKVSEKNRLLKENEELRSKIRDSRDVEQRRRETRAYDQGLYDGRGTDALYRQCLRKYMRQEQQTIITNGEKED